MTKLSLKSPLVSVDWLYANLNAENLIVLDATIKKVTEGTESIRQDYIPKTRFFDLKFKFSDVSAPFPNTISSESQFTEEAQKLGINKDSAIVVYDTKGIYSSPRVWWLFKVMGYTNIAVLDGGLPEWNLKKLPVEPLKNYKGKKGNFVAKYSSESMRFFKDLELASKDDSQLIIDARSSGRFKGEAIEPRAGLRSGSIPNSINIPYTNFLNGNILKSLPELKEELKVIANSNDAIIFSCGSGITACVLALGATLSGYKNLSVYDGSWTEWGSLT